MMNDEMPRGMSMQPNRKSYPPKYPEKPYSPSLNYNGNYNQNYNQGNYNQGQAQNSRRRFDRFKKDGGPNTNERLIHQNDSIIRLLKEIRDRLPAPPAAAVQATAGAGGASVPEMAVTESSEVNKNDPGGNVSGVTVPESGPETDDADNEFNRSQA